MDAPVVGSGGSVAPASGPAAPSAPAGPSAPASRVPVLQPPAYASRIVIADLAIDLPVVSGDLQPPPSYPLCDVAAYVTRFGQPYETGITYISAHAQEGMFLPLLEGSQRDDGRQLLGTRIDVYTNDGMRYGYAIERVVRHVTDYGIVTDLSPDERTLILQTSEGPYGTTEKVQFLAVPLDEAAVDPAEANPEPRPRDCRPPELVGEEDPPKPSEAPPAQEPVVVSEPTPSSAPVEMPSPMASAGPTGGLGLGEAEVASRVVVTGLGIDMPVISGDLQPPPNYPFCDVAAYVTFLGQPHEPGTTYLTAHAQEGMFLPLLEASQRNDGRELLGMNVDVYTTHALRYRYRIWQVRRHILDRAIATEGLQADEHRLVLQTSEGPYGTLEKIAVAARLLDVEPTDARSAVPTARPRDCRPPELRNSPQP